MLTEAELAAAVATCDVQDLAEELGGSVTDDGVISFADLGDLDAFCELLEELGATVRDDR